MTDPSTLDPDVARAAIEYCYEQGWTDGLPVVPPSEDEVQKFLNHGGRDPQEVLAAMDHLGRVCTVEQAAISAIMAGCLPEHFPVVMATLEALRGEGTCFRGGCASTTGPCPFIVVNGPIRDQLEFNSTGNIFGSGFRANATVGRAVRLVILNVFGMRPHELDQATHGTPAKYSFCIAENEEESPWEPLHVEKGLPVDASAVTVYMARNTLHVENRDTQDPEQVLLTIADAMSYAGSVMSRGGSTTAVVMGPEHAQLVAGAGWSKADVKRFLWEHHGRPLGDLRRMGKGKVDPQMPASYEVLADNQKAGIPGPVQKTDDEPDDKFIHFSAAPERILLVVAGAKNAGISTVIPPFGAFGNPTSYTQRIRVP